MKKNYNRNFKINGMEFIIADICDQHNKYRIDVLTNKGYWTQINKCNTLAEGKEIARDYQEYIKEMENGCMK